MLLITQDHNLIILVSYLHTSTPQHFSLSNFIWRSHKGQCLIVIQQHSLVDINNNKKKISACSTLQGCINIETIKQQLSTDRYNWCNKIACNRLTHFKGTTFKVATIEIQRYLFIDVLVSEYVRNKYQHFSNEILAIKDFLPHTVYL